MYEDANYTVSMQRSTNASTGTSKVAKK